MSIRNIANWFVGRSKNSRGEIDILKSANILLFKSPVCRTKRSRSWRLPTLNNFLAVALLLSGCAGLPVRGKVGGQMIDTRVDSEAARYYLGSYLAGERRDDALDKRIDRVYQIAN